MQKGVMKQGGLLLVLGALVLGGLITTLPVQATTLQSDNFEVSETQFGAGATLESCSGQYCAQATVGGLSVGDGAASAGVTTFSALPEDSEPLLEVILEDGAANLGTLSIDKAATKETIVRVRNYKSNGYTVHLVGTPPTYDGRALSVLREPTESTPGTEQFGINVVKNTTPDVGALPLQVPSSSTSFGKAAVGYDQPNLFQFISEDTIASSDTESGRTDYTISMIVNVAGSTPAGKYTTDLSVVVVPVF